MLPVASRVRSLSQEGEGSFRVGADRDPAWGSAPHLHRLRIARAASRGDPERPGETQERVERGDILAPLKQANGRSDHGRSPRRLAVSGQPALRACRSQLLPERLRRLHRTPPLSHHLTIGASIGTCAQEELRNICIIARHRCRARRAICERRSRVTLDVSHPGRAYPGILGRLLRGARGARLDAPRCRGAHRRPQRPRRAHRERTTSAAAHHAGPVYPGLRAAARSRPPPPFP